VQAPEGPETPEQLILSKGRNQRNGQAETIAYAAQIFPSKAGTVPFQSLAACLVVR